MARPAVHAAVAFATNPGAAPTWTDVTAYLESFRLTRGRAHELDKVEAGSLDLVLDNFDRRFDPTHATGPYFGTILPMRRVRIQVVWDSITYDLFHGFVESWGLVYPPDRPLDSSVTVRCSDGLLVLAKAPLVAAVFAQQRTDLRIGAVLDAIGWPAADRNLMTGQQEAQGGTFSLSALAHVQGVSDAENGFLFMAKDGKLTFHDRHRRIKQPITTQVVMGDGGGSEEYYVDAKMEYGDSLLKNRVEVTRTGGITQVATDSASITKYYTRAEQRSGLPMATDADAYAMAEHLVQRYKEPALRVKELDLNAEHDPAVMWPHVLGRELGDRISVRKRPPVGAMLEQVSTIEAMAIDWIAPGDVWRVFWSVSPADTQTYWQLEDATYGVLDSTTRLAY